MRIQFVFDNTQGFADKIKIPIAVCVMKLIVDLSIETMSLVLTASFNNVSDLIMNFISMNCIS